MEVSEYQHVQHIVFIETEAEFVLTNLLQFSQIILFCCNQELCGIALEVPHSVAVDVDEHLAESVRVGVLDIHLVVPPLLHLVSKHGLEDC